MSSKCGLTFWLITFCRQETLFKFSFVETWSCEVFLQMTCFSGITAVSVGWYQVVGLLCAIVCLGGGGGGGGGTVVCLQGRPRDIDVKHNFWFNLKSFYQQGQTVRNSPQNCFWFYNTWPSNVITILSIQKSLTTAKTVSQLLGSGESIIISRL